MSEYVIAVKAEGEAWALDVLGVPFGGPHGGKDSQGEYFDAQTDLYLQEGDRRPVVYYHGGDPDGYAKARPERIGWATFTGTRADGGWFRVVLDQASDYARRVWEAAQKGVARASSGAVAHLVRKGPGGHIRHWPVGELSLLDAEGKRQPVNAYAVALPALKATFEQAGITLPDVLNDTDGADEPEADPAEGDGQPDADTSGAATTEATQTTTGENIMGETNTQAAELQAAVNEAVNKALEAERERQAAEAARQQEIADARKQAADEAREAMKAEMVAAGRLPEGDGQKAPAVITGEIRKYDNLSAGDHALMIGLLEAGRMHPKTQRPTDAAVKALAMKLEAEEAKGEGLGVESMGALKAAGFAGKANELNYATYATYGDEFVGVAYSRVLWESIRQEAWVADWLPKVEVPQGTESITIPVEGADPTFYKTAEATGLSAAASPEPNSTVTSSHSGTTSDSLTVSKLSARTIWSGELTEDSLIPWMEYTRMKLVKAGSYYLDSSIIDGDTAAGASANINDIAGTPNSTDWFLLYDGFRKLALVTNTANSRAGGDLTTEDFIETLKLLGPGGFNANPSNTLFIVSPPVAWKMLELEDLKTRDVFGNPTLERGLPTALWGGYQIRPAWMYGYAGKLVNTGYEFKENSAGKIDVDTASNNTYGSFLAVNRDQWLFGWKRRQTLETVRHAVSDSYTLVAHMRCGLVYRDTEASAITYAVTV